MSTVSYVRTELLPEKAPPASTVGAIGWAREKLFSSYLNSAITVVFLIAIFYLLKGLIPWFFSPTWDAGSIKECQAITAGGHGACWGVIHDRWVQLLFGFYPAEHYWRPILAFVLLFVALAPILFSEYVPRKLIWFSAFYVLLMPWLLWGGAFWSPLLIVLGFALTYYGGKFISQKFGAPAGMIAAVVIFAAWFLYGLGATNYGINRAVGQMRLDSKIQELTQQIDSLKAQRVDIREQIADILARTRDTEAKVDEILSKDVITDEDSKTLHDLLDELAPARIEVARLRTRLNNINQALADDETLIRQSKQMPALIAALPAKKAKAKELRAALPDTVSTILTENGLKSLITRIRDDNLEIPRADVAAITAAIDAEKDLRNSLAKIQQVYADVARIGLKPVVSRDFGGLLLSLTIGVVAIAVSLPLGIVLALGRQSNLPIIRAICVGFIEFIRGVPLITLLFVASTLLNIFLPPGTNFDIILRVIIMATLFSAAYMAEVIRGGLAAIPKGQYEGAASLGLNYWQSQRLIIMPQALKISIPGIVGSFIGLFKDTTLVSIIGLLDPIGLSNAIRADTDWTGIVWELYGFIAFLFFIFCFSMSRYSMYLENKLKTSH
jgi:His/Glu/Gln/Arg/opine family amino acid ABC transporter permease subunit